MKKGKIAIITTLAFVAICCELNSCNKSSGKNKQEKIARLLGRAYENQEFVGNVLVADSGRIIYQNSFGKSDAGRNIENSDSTKFLIASLSKPITAITMLRLVERGLIKLGDPISSFFEIENPDIGKITIHQLLSHSSGISEFISKEEHFDFISTLNKATATFPPGSDFEYSNSGYVLLIKIGEKVTGKNYEEIVRGEIFEPANMKRSGVARNNSASKLAIGYKDALQKEATSVDFPLTNLDGAGSLYSTTGDLYKLDCALRNNTLLSEKTKALLLRQHIPKKYAYGWFVRERGGIWDVYWCKGNLTGATTYMSRRIQKNQLIILLANVENLDIDDIANDIASVLKAEE